jgi:hypothetical protein
VLPIIGGRSYQRQRWRALWYRRRILPAGESYDRIMEVDTIEVHHEIDDASAGGALPAQPGVLGDVHGEPIRARAFAAIAAFRARSNELPALAPQFDPSATDFIDNRHSTGAVDGFMVDACGHHAPPSTSGSSL